MPAKSAAQRRLMAQALEVKKGDLKPEDLNPDYKDEIVKLADEMSLKDLEDFASTSEEDLDESEKLVLEHLISFEDYKLYEGMQIFDIIELMKKWVRSQTPPEHVGDCIVETNHKDDSIIVSILSGAIGTVDLSILTKKVEKLFKDGISVISSGNHVTYEIDRVAFNPQTIKLLTDAVKLKR